MITMRTFYPNDAYLFENALNRYLYVWKSILIILFSEELYYKQPDEHQILKYK
jgi:hypothetical protein